MGKPAVYSNTRKETHKYNTWRNAEFHNVKVGAKSIYHNGLKDQKITIFF
jgi:hypothetical protein